MEEWKEIEGFNNYFISNTGKVRRDNKLPLKYQLDERGYPRIRLGYLNKRNFRIHRLVAIYFIPNPNNYPQVNHIDGDKTNNNVENLEWCNNSDNQKHAILKGLKITKKGKDAARFKCSILVFDKEGNQIDELFGNEDMKIKGYDFRNVSAVVTSKRKTYKKLIFKRNN